MKEHSKEFKEKISTLGRQQDIKITYTIDGEEKILTSEDINSATPCYEGSLLKSVMKELELDSNVKIPKETELNFKYGLLMKNEDVNFKNASGTKVIAEEAIKYPVSNFNIHGKSTQATRSGKNLVKFPYVDTTKTMNGITFTVNDDGTVLINGKATSLSYLILSNTVDYGGAISGAGLGTNGNYAVPTTNSNTAFMNYNNANKILSINVNSGVTINNLLFKPILIEGTSVTQDEWEQYGASPSPEFPSEIKSVGDDVNLFDGNYILGTIDTSGKEQTSSTALRSGYIEVKGNTDYILSSPDNASYIRTLLYDKNKTFIKTVPSLTSFLTTEDTKYFRFVISGTDTNTRIKFQKGTVATPYSEYGKGTVTIEQRGKNLCYNCTLVNKNQTLRFYFNKNITKKCTLSFTTNDSFLGNSLYLVIDDINSELISTVSGDANSKVSQDITLTDKQYQAIKNSNKACFQIYKKDGNLNIPDDAQIEEGDTATDYEPYFSKDYVLPVSAPLRSLPNGTKDTIEEDGIHRRVGNYICNGAETVTINNQYVNAFRIENIPNAYTESTSVLNDALCSHFKEDLQSKIYSGSIGFAMLGGTINKAYICFGTDSEINTVDKIKEWLTEQYNVGTPLIFQYELAEEVVEPFTEEQLEVIQSIETNLYTQYFTSDANMRITYVRNNGLADMYETKDSANRNYTKTEQKMSELNIDIDGITQEVSNVKTDLSENYPTTTETKSLIKQTADSISSEVSKKVGEQNQKISVVEQTVNELNSKISDIADITTSGESMQAKVELTGINQSEPIAINVHPIGENISYLYPHSNLYPSDTLYLKTRTLRFVRTFQEDNETKTENIDYILPDDLLYYDSDNYDEFILNYDSQTCQVRKRCKYNADGTVALLDSEITTDYSYPSILLGDGDYTIELLGYNVGYLSVRLMAQNIYTTQFATRAEVNSEISQKANEITATVSTTYATKGELNTAKSEIKQTTNSIQAQVNNNNTDISTLKQTATDISSEVSKKVGNNEIISKINQSAEQVQINANKISLARKNSKFNWRQYKYI